MKKNNLIYLLLSILIFIYLIVKANWQGISHDEAATFFHYIHAKVFIPGDALWDANNHIINSFLSIQLYKLFGEDLIFLRLSNVLSFILYAYYVYKTSNFLRNSWIKYAFQIGLLTPIFLLDFFTLTRGYGMSIAFLWAALFHFSHFFQTQSLKDNFLFWFFIGLATWANLSLINNYLIIIAIYFVFLMLNFKKSDLSQKLLFVFPGLFLFLGAALYSYKMKLLGLLYYGNQDGFVATTLSSLANFQFGSDNYWLAFFWLILMLLSVVLILFNVFKVKNFIQLFSFKYTVAVLLLLNIIGVLMLNLILGVNFPEDRAAIYFIPLFIAAFALAVDELTFAVNNNFKYLGLLLLTIPIFFLSHTSLQGTKLWSTLYMNKEMYKAVEIEQEKTDRLLTINGYRLHKMSWAYLNLNKNLGDMYSNPYPDTCSDIIFAVDTDYELDNFTSYHKIYHSDFNKMSVWKRKVFLEKKVFFESEENFEYEGASEFFEIYNDTVNSENKNINIYFETIISTVEKPFLGSVVFEAKDDNDKLVLYEAIPLDWMRSEWNNDTIKIQINLLTKNHDKLLLKIYFWNFKEKKYHLKTSNFSFSFLE